MQRRKFIILIGGAAAWPLVARAQQPAKVKRIAMVALAGPVANMVDRSHRAWRAFFDEVSRAGYEEGKTLSSTKDTPPGDKSTALPRWLVKSSIHVLTLSTR